MRKGEEARDEMVKDVYVQILRDGEEEMIKVIRAGSTCGRCQETIMRAQKTLH